MNGCVHRTADNHCAKCTDDKHESFCKFYECQEKCPSNADVIKSMPVENLAWFLEEQIWDLPWCDSENPVDPKTKRCEKWDCMECCIEWLNAEANIKRVSAEEFIKKAEELQLSEIIFSGGNDHD